MRDEDISLWQNLTNFVAGLAYVAKELRKGTHYRFRVRAENKFGASKAAETDVVLAKDPYGTQCELDKCFFLLFCFFVTYYLVAYWLRR